MNLGPYLLGPNDTPENGIYTGDARELAKAIPDESVDLIFTDPVYDRIDDYRWLAETGARVLREDRACLVFQYPNLLSKTMRVMEASLIYQWQIIWYINNRTKYVYSPTGKSAYIPALIFSNGSKLYRPGFAFDIKATAFGGFLQNHKWSKSPEWIAYYIKALSKRDAYILDPFTGGGTVPAVCKMLNRRYLAFEIDPEVAQMARDRVRHTQPPLPIEMPTQEVLL